MHDHEDKTFNGCITKLQGRNFVWLKGISNYRLFFLHPPQRFLGRYSLTFNIFLVLLPPTNFLSIKNKHYNSRQQQFMTGPWHDIKFIYILYGHSVFFPFRCFVCGDNLGKLSLDGIVTLSFYEFGDLRRMPYGITLPSVAKGTPIYLKYFLRHFFPV